jgi:hypothetical protein
VTETRQTFVIELLDKYGVPIALLGYFMWKDYMFTSQVVTLMTKVDSLMTKVALILGN